MGEKTQQIGLMCQKSVGESLSGGKIKKNQPEFSGISPEFRQNSPEIAPNHRRRAPGGQPNHKWSPLSQRARHGRDLGGILDLVGPGAD